jgi:benzil reductase ((S)-benzoin forming)
MKSKDKTLILVTGTSSGIGKELRLILYKDLKYDLKVFHSRTPSNEYIENENNKFLFGNLEDFSNGWFDDYDLNSFSTIVFVNNASTIQPINKFKNISIGLLNKSISINILATAKIIQQLLNLKKENANLIIFNISSGASTNPIDGWSSYCLTKSATKMMLDVINLENEDVQVFHHDPGIVNTNMQRKIRESSKNQMNDIEYFKNVELTKADIAAKKILHELDTIMSMK